MRREMELDINRHVFWNFVMGRLHRYLLIKYQVWCCAPLNALLHSVNAFANSTPTQCLSTKCWFHPISPSKTVMNGAVCALLSWQNTPILLHARQKRENNKLRIWQFKRSIKAPQRLTIKAASPFKDGSKDPFATLLFWRIELYKFRVKANCFFFL